MVGGLVVEHTDAVVQMLPRMKKIKKSSKGGGEGVMWMWNYYYFFSTPAERAPERLLTYSIAKLERTTLLA